jgi:tRNA modification GTPase
VDHVSNKMIRSEETICAPATSGGGAIAVIRLSGLLSIDICEKIFFPFDKKIKLAELKGYSLIYGDILKDEEVVDDVMVSVFRAPHSYTGENAIEISCHASAYIQQSILGLLIRNGAVAAQPGEFTRRAFLNGKMDLLQAEAVADIIASSSEAAHKVALNQMRGGFSKEIGKLRSQLLHFASMIELELDFGEEDVEFADREKLKQLVISIKSLADKLASSFMVGNAIRNGIPVTITGKPNSGKSTLLNAILMEEKAIVSDIPGTTRDTIEDTIVIEGIEYRFIDTAGLRETSDIIENLGIKKTHEKIDQASVILYIDDIYDTAELINNRIDAIRELILSSGKRLFILINKIDQDKGGRVRELSFNIEKKETDTLLFISAKEHIGIDVLKQKLGEIILKEKLSTGNVIITNIRHYEAMIRVSESLGRVLYGLEEQIPSDLIAIDIRQAIHYLGEITGEITSDEILGNIFKNFCIGK